MEKYNINNEIKNISIRAGEIESFCVIYGDYPEVRFDIEGNLEDFEYSVEGYSLEIHTLKEKMINNSWRSAKEEVKKVSLLHIYVPLDAVISYDFQLVGSNVRFVHDKEVQIPRIHVEGVLAHLQISNMDTHLSMSGVQCKVSGEHLGGSYNMEGVKALVQIFDPLDNLDISAEGMSVRVGIYLAHEDDYNYDLDCQGLSTKIKFFGRKVSSSIGGSTLRQGSSKGNSKNIKVRVEGVSSKVEIDH